MRILTTTLNIHIASRRTGRAKGGPKFCTPRWDMSLTGPIERCEQALNPLLVVLRCAFKLCDLTTRVMSGRQLPMSIEVMIHDDSQSSRLFNLHALSIKFKNAWHPRRILHICNLRFASPSQAPNSNYFSHYLLHAFCLILLTISIKTLDY